MYAYFRWRGDLLQRKIHASPRKSSSEGLLHLEDVMVAKHSFAKLNPKAFSRTRYMTDTNRLRIAMQKSGRLSDDSQDLLESCGLKVRFHSQRLLAVAENMPVEILRVRDDDIPGLVMDGVVDLGIIGENVLEETLLARKNQGETPQFRLLRRFDFGDCRLSIAIPTDETWQRFKRLG